MNARSLYRRLLRKYRPTFWGSRTYIPLHIPPKYVLLPCPENVWTRGHFEEVDEDGQTSRVCLHTFSSWGRDRAAEDHEVIYLREVESDGDVRTWGVAGYKHRGEDGEIYRNREKLEAFARYMAWQDAGYDQILVPELVSHFGMAFFYSKTHYITPRADGGITLTFSVKPYHYHLRKVTSGIRSALRWANRQGCPIPIKLT